MSVDFIRQTAKDYAIDIEIVQFIYDDKENLIEFYERVEYVSKRARYLVK